jgi:hypothetical protein
MPMVRSCTPVYEQPAKRPAWVASARVGRLSPRGSPQPARPSVVSNDGLLARRRLPWATDHPWGGSGRRVSQGAELGWCEGRGIGHQERTVRAWAGRPHGPPMKQTGGWCAGGHARDGGVESPRAVRPAWYRHPLRRGAGVGCGGSVALPRDGARGPLPRAPGRRTGASLGCGGEADSRRHPAGRAVRPGHRSPSTPRRSRR